MKENFISRTGRIYREIEFGGYAQTDTADEYTRRRTGENENKNESMHLTPLDE